MEEEEGAVEEVVDAAVAAVHEVVEEVVEYEYQIVDGQRKLVGERKVGGSISSQQEVCTVS